MSEKSTHVAQGSTEVGPLLGLESQSAPLSRYEESRTKALQLFACKGFGQVSMRDLARHLGLTAGSLYHHFPSKQHLLFELLEEFYEDMGAILHDCLQPRRDKAKALQRFIKARLALHREFPFHSRVVQRDTASLEDEYRHRIEKMKRQFEEGLMRLMGGTGTRVDPKRDASSHVIAELITNLPDWLESHPISEVERERVAELLIIGAVQGIRLQQAS
ncbi:MULTISPECIES: TetR/AcrR family transcriptional regulator [Pseudomonas]|uniref:TetR/AcrR family transcriptional regulator n=1 Tax=Pseudomonas TaxID=286 RepID=UPI0010758343|nr:MULTISPECIES: TetR/AcrR family transcriptional regulator [Pseudomonas]MBM7396836.1 AcrR family transcriptional regulator [Pseudomonas sp. M5]TFW39910.1 TetR/AcrR family transcriptional regulator [Pseudomonas putida]HDS1756089.1 TetR/AcrR family transcriptional regulator [Pseudomonas putida]